MTRRWTGGESVSDPEHHRFGGVLVSGLQTDDRDTDNIGKVGVEAVNWFAAGPDYIRLYLQMTASRLREIGADRTFDAIVAYAAQVMPDGALDDVQQEGPIGFFANSDTWATQVAGNDVVLVGDAAGAPDPSQGHGTALLFHDVRTLSELLLADRIGPPRPPSTPSDALRISLRCWLRPLGESPCRSGTGRRSAPRGPPAGERSGSHPRRILPDRSPGTRWAGG